MAQYNTGSSSTPIWVNISDWSPTQTFFNRYMNLTSPTFQWDVRGWNPNPVRFLATNPNTSLPVDAYYLVDLSNDSFATDHYWLFTRTATGSTPSARQYLDSLPAGTYAWKISILNGNDHYGSLITGWTDAPSTIHIDPH
jgi:hypothetical protein